MLSKLQLQCLQCGSASSKLEIILPFKMRETWFTEEREVRSFIINALLKRNLSVWDCTGETLGCKDPIMVDDIPMRIWAGDIPFFWDDRNYIIEIKLTTHICYYNDAAKSFTAIRPTPLITDLQWEMLLMGGGVLVIVSEPIPSSVIDISINDEQREKCEALLNDYKVLLGNSQISYEVYIINQERFTRFWKEYLETAYETVRGRPRRKKAQVTRKLSFHALKKFIPESMVRLTKQDFLNGRIVDEILLSLKT